KEKLNGTNFADWSRNLRIVLRQDKKEHVLEEPIPDVPADNATAILKSAYKKACDESLDVSCLMLAAMNSDLQKQFENIEAYDMIVTLKGMLETQARTERYEISKKLFGSKLTEGSPVSPYVIKMVGYTQSLEKLGFPLRQELATDLILASLPASYGQFIMTVHMNGLDKNLTELHMMLKTAEDSIKKSNSHVMMVQKSTSFKKKARTWVKGKGKKVSDVIQTNKPKPKTKSGPTQENEYFYCKEPGHWERNCKKYLADLKRNGGTKPSTSGINGIDVFLADSSVNS
ncbi:hypothetical protein JGD43_25455, partial [Salmonella enterica subsp. enterica serovar Goldcoast]|nr:hypothetical protein [Salmonella enterica subsp. enterica serovar Goldcoast]